MIKDVRVEDGYVIIYFRPKYMNQDCWCYGEFYKQLGLLQWFEKYPEMADVRNIYCTERTNNIVKGIIKDKFSLVNIKKDRQGEYKVSLYRVRRKKLTKTDEMSLAMDFLNYSPTDFPSIPDGVIIFRFDKDKEIDIEKVWGNS